ncbi:glycosyl hydrolase [Cryobacterium cryoconiti]|uniref:glucan endo-1,3-beta-D-glucosidase n=1 Tax=Cryobacterium cryoconiti TaxID=1259239 RepID=A0A4Y8JU01_9MICO|nr:glycosyl hydrolase [Cryobacterium cryoconiti]TFD29004.1 1,3-beta-glucanase [Cryobacterium cryoconiti]
MHRLIRRATTLLTALLVSVLLLTGCEPAAGPSGPPPGARTSNAEGSGAEAGSTEVVSSDVAIGPLVGAVPQRTLKPLPAARLAPGLIPPTNRWFSGLVYGQPSMPVFPLPLSFRLDAGGFAFGVPTVTTSAKLIAGGFTGHIAADLGADTQTVTAYDEASVTITARRNGTDLGRTVIARGSPFVTFTAEQPTVVSLGTSFAAAAGAGRAWTATIAGSTYGLVSGGVLDPAGTALTLQTDQVATWFALAEGGALADFVAAAGHPITATDVAYELADGRARTRLSYQTADGGDTLAVAMPHQSGQSASRCDAGTYPSIFGELRVCAGANLDWSVDEVTPKGSLDLSGVDETWRVRLAKQVEEDIAASPGFAADTYFGGKSLFRAANLLSIAEQVGADDAAAEIRGRLVDALTEWTEPGGCLQRDQRCFVYDPEASGVVGLTPSFGSDEFNDHHFHYGYFLYAAGVVAASDPALAERWAPVLNLLAADVATSAPSRYFPVRRVFDAYSGHSWAGGTAPFGDGNNQESSSEAVTAWNGLALWAAASNQPGLAADAGWMLSAEAASARAYWTDFPLDPVSQSAFEHTITSLVWGGKRDYATWFSAEPSAMLGIVVLPMSPVADYLGVDPARVRVNLADSAPDGYDVLFGDYLLMYSVLAGPESAAAALDLAIALPDERIDDGNSRSYLLAWILAHQKP